MKNKLILILAILGLIFIIACGNKENIRIGFIGPLSGDVASIGQSVKAAIELGVEEVNQAGGINGQPLEVIYEDGKCGPKDSTDAANKLINIDKVPVIIGGGCSSETLAAAPIAETSKVTLLSYCSSNPKITEAGDYIFRTYPSDAFQGKVAAEKIYNELNAKNVAILYCLGDWCVGIKDVFKKRFGELGGSITIEEGYEQDARDLRTQITKIKDSKPDLIYFLGYTEASIVGLKQLKEMGVEIPKFGGDAWDDPKLWDEAKDSGDGARYLVPDSPGTAEFKAKMETKTGSNELPVCTPQAYDDVNIIAEIMKRVGIDSEKIKNELYNVQGYKGVSGEISLDSNGDLMTANYVTKFVKNGKAVVE